MQSAPQAVAANYAIGESWVVTNGVWNSSVALTYAYQWSLDGVDIDGATQSSYLVPNDPALVGRSLQAKVTATATNMAGSASQYAYSPGYVIQPRPAP